MTSHTLDKVEARTLLIRPCHAQAAHPSRVHPKGITMTFAARFIPVETEAEEQARLAAAPVGSVHHHLSQLPVTHGGYIVPGMLFELPAEVRNGHRMIVVVVANRGSVGKQPRFGQVRERSLDFECMIVGSTHPVYQVGYNNIPVSECELRRSRHIDPLI